jgi:hypothetical protein
MPYKGTTATMVGATFKDNVDHLRNDVKTRYADSHLTGIAASDLRVYKNKAAFDKRNDTLEKEVPLRPDSCLLNASLGESMDDPVVVVVPSPLTISCKSIDLEAYCKGCSDIIVSRHSNFYVVDCQRCGSQNYW